MRVQNGCHAFPVPRIPIFFPELPELFSFFDKFWYVCGKRKAVVKRIFHILLTVVLAVFVYYTTGTAYEKFHAGFGAIHGLSDSRLQTESSSAIEVERSGETTTSFFSAGAERFLADVCLTDLYYPTGTVQGSANGQVRRTEPGASEYLGEAPCLILSRSVLPSEWQGDKTRRAEELKSVQARARIGMDIPPYYVFPLRKLLM